DAFVITEIVNCSYLKLSGNSRICDQTEVLADSAHGSRISASQVRKSQPRSGGILIRGRLWRIDDGRPHRLENIDETVGAASGSFPQVGVIGQREELRE